MLVDGLKVLQNLGVYDRAQDRYLLYNLAHFYIESEDTDHKKNRNTEHDTSFHAHDPFEELFSLGDVTIHALIFLHVLFEFWYPHESGWGNTE